MGGGYYSVKLCNDLELSDIAFVVDSDSKKVGNSIVLHNKRYVISKINVLDNLASENYFIIIGSKDYKDEISLQIKENFGDRFPVCYRLEKPTYYWMNNFTREYEDIFEMFYQDPLALQRICYFHAATSLRQMIPTIKEIIDEFVPKNKRHQYRLNTCGYNNFSFVIDDKYFVRLPIFRNRDRTSIENYYNIRKTIRDILGFNKNLVIYEDKTGLLIENYANPIIDWSDKNNVKSILQKIHQLHGSNLKLDNLTHLNLSQKLKEYQRNYKEQLLPSDVTEWLNRDLQEEILNYEEVVCHGDFHPVNIVEFDGELEIIDWESVFISDPIYDVCRFLIFNNIKLKRDLLMELEEFLTMYYGRAPTQSELRHAKAVGMLCTYEYYFKSMTITFFPTNVIRNWIVENAFTV